MCSAAPRSRWTIAAAAPWSAATTSAPRIPRARRSFRSTAMSSSPRPPSPCRCSATRRPITKSAAFWRASRCFRSARTSLAPTALGKAQRVHRPAAPRRLGAADLPAWRAGPTLQALRGARHSSRRPAAGDRRGKVRSGRRHRAGAARRHCRPVGRGGSPIPWSAWPPAGCACASAPSPRGVELPLVILRPRRLGRAERHHRRGGAHPRSG